MDWSWEPSFAPPTCAFLLGGSEPLGDSPHPARPCTMPHLCTHHPPPPTAAPSAAPTPWCALSLSARVSARTCMSPAGRGAQRGGQRGAGLLARHVEGRVTMGEAAPAQPLVLCSVFWDLCFAGTGFCGFCGDCRLWVLGGELTPPSRWHPLLRAIRVPHLDTTVTIGRGASTMTLYFNHSTLPHLLVLLASSPKLGVQDVGVRVSGMHSTASHVHLCPIQVGLCNGLEGALRRRGRGASRRGWVSSPHG